LWLYKIELLHSGNKKHSTRDARTSIKHNGQKSTDTIETSLRIGCYKYWLWWVRVKGCNERKYVHWYMLKWKVARASCKFVTPFP
jgi:hypothetical protein